MEAFGLFKYVVKEDGKNYESSIKKCEVCKNIVVPEMLKKAAEYASKQDYKNETECMDNAIYVDPTNQKLVDLRTKYDNDYVKAKAKQL